MAKSNIATEESEPGDDVLSAETEAEDGPNDDWDSAQELDDSVEDDDAVDDEDGDTAVVAEDGADDEALDELEAEELEMLTDDEASEAIVVDEAQELRAIRRAEISMETDTGGERATDEFVCQSCYLVLKSSQLADKRRKYCRDCAG